MTAILQQIGNYFKNSLNNSKTKSFPDSRKNSPVTI